MLSQFKFNDLKEFDKFCEIIPYSLTSNITEKQGHNCFSTLNSFNSILIFSIDNNTDDGVEEEEVIVEKDEEDNDSKNQTKVCSSRKNIGSKIE